MTTTLLYHVIHSSFAAGNLQSDFRLLATGTTLETARHLLRVWITLNNYRADDDIEKLLVTKYKGHCAHNIVYDYWCPDGDNFSILQIPENSVIGEFCKNGETPWWWYPEKLEDVTNTIPGTEPLTELLKK